MNHNQIIPAVITPAYIGEIKQPLLQKPSINKIRLIGLLIQYIKPLLEMDLNLTQLDDIYTEIKYTNGYIVEHRLDFKCLFAMRFIELEDDRMIYLIEAYIGSLLSNDNMMTLTEFCSLIIYSLAHEYRHIYQHHNSIYMELNCIDYDEYVDDYVDINYEKDANEYADKFVEKYETSITYIMSEIVKYMISENPTLYLYIFDPVMFIYKAFNESELSIVIRNILDLDNDSIRIYHRYMDGDIYFEVDYIDNCYIINFNANVMKIVCNGLSDFYEIDTQFKSYICDLIESALLDIYIMKNNIEDNIHIIDCYDEAMYPIRNRLYDTLEKDLLLFIANNTI